MFVPVISLDRKPLMPTTPSRARRWIKTRKAMPFWSKGVFCVRLNQEPSGTELQQVAIGIDPGSKREAFTVKSKAHTYLNVLADAVTWVSQRMYNRKGARDVRRARNTPCRTPRFNRSHGGIPPSTKARWQLKLRVVSWLVHILPASVFVVEDIKARPRGKRLWDMHFSPLEVGKHWFYAKLRAFGVVRTEPGYNTKAARDYRGLTKTRNKMCESFNAHNVDSWVLANMETDNGTLPENRVIHRLVPFNFSRRQLHRFNPTKGGVYQRYGGTMCLGLKKGSIVYNAHYGGLCYVSGHSHARVRLHDIKTGERLTQEARPEATRFLCYSGFRGWTIT